MNRMLMNRSRLALAAIASCPILAAAAPAGSPYVTDPQGSHVEDATSQGIAQVNMITCFMTGMRPDALVNKGPYAALVDKKKCDPNSRSDAGNSSGADAGSSSPAYLGSVVDASRSSNNEPMRVRTWIDQSEKDTPATIFVNTLATEAPSASNPYGVFRIDYCGKGGGAGCQMNGYLDGSASGISYFEIESEGGRSNVTALRLTTPDADSGSGSLQVSGMGPAVGYTFGYNGSYFRRFDGTSDECFSRLADDPEAAMSVWSYGLYDAVSGERVTLQSGFPIDYVAADGKTYSGQIGYWGLWLPADGAAQIGNGATVQRVQYAADQTLTRTAFTLLKAEGRLTMYTKKTRSLASTDKIRFNTFVFDVTGFFAGAEANRQYEMYWDEAAGAFEASGVVVCGDSGCQTQDLAGGAKTVAASFFAPQGGVRGWSQALGGELFIPLAGGPSPIDSASVSVIYRVQSLVYPGQMPATLYCLRDCPTGTTLAGYFAAGSADASPFVAATYNHWQPSAPAEVVSYSSDAAAALLRDGAGAAVTFGDASALQSRPQYASGVRSGRLFTALSDAVCAGDPSSYCDQNVDQLDVYYQWETGSNQWNQFAAVKDAAGAVVAFDPPLQVSYAVPVGAKYGPYAGKTIVLQYGGFGQLWGVPGECVSRLTNEHVSCETAESRYVPAFAIPFDETLGRVSAGSSDFLVKWLDREIRLARKDTSVCVAAGVSLPAGVALPDAGGLQNPSDPLSAIYIGAKPVVTDAARVIDGDVKY